MTSKADAWREGHRPRTGAPRRAEPARERLPHVHGLLADCVAQKAADGEEPLVQREEVVGSEGAARERGPREGRVFRPPDEASLARELYVAAIG